MSETVVYFVLHSGVVYSNCLRLLWVVAMTMLATTTTFAYTPEDPEVQEMVARGIKHLERTLGEKKYFDTGKAHLGGWGEWALAGYAHFKVEHDATNAVVVKGIEGALGIANGLKEPPPEGHHSNQTNYNIGVSAMLLAEVDRIKYRKELEAIGAYLMQHQMTHGGYGYYGDTLGDTSQTQYAMLALWTLDHAGVVIDYTGIPRTVGWLTRVQDKSGGWPYRGEDVRGSVNRVEQLGVTPSMAVAGGSAILIAGDILRLWGNASDDPKIPDLPKAVKLYKESLAKVKRPVVSADPFLRAIEECQKYLSNNSPNPGVTISRWPYYQLYSLERYESFRELAFSLEKKAGPAWYNGGVDYLKKARDDNGGWSKFDIMPSSVSTSFAVLFLIRSTQKSIQAVNKGSLAGGYGLPSDTTTLVVEGTQIKGEAAASSVTDLLGLLEADGADKLDGKSIPENLKLESDPARRKAQLGRLERLLRGSRSWQARRVAARLIGQSDEHSMIPVLIFALSDNDKTVRSYALDGLNFISRRFISDVSMREATPEDIRRIQGTWTEWYKQVEPGYVLIEGY